MPRDNAAPGRSWMLRRTDRLQPRQLRRLYLSLCLPTLVIAALFAGAGYWYVLPYALAELVLLAGCLWCYWRHTDDYDKIAITDGAILIVQRRSCHSSEFELNRWCASVTMPTRNGAPIHLTDSYTSIAVGQLVSDKLRRQVAWELGAYLPALPSQPMLRGLNQRGGRN